MGITIAKTELELQHDDLDVASQPLIRYLKEHYHRKDVSVYITITRSGYKVQLLNSVKSISFDMAERSINACNRY